MKTTKKNGFTAVQTVSIASLYLSFSDSSCILSTVACSFFTKKWGVDGAHHSSYLRSRCQAALTIGHTSTTKQAEIYTDLELVWRNFLVFTIALSLELSQCCNLIWSNLPGTMISFDRGFAYALLLWVFTVVPPLVGLQVILSNIIRLFAIT